MVCSKQFKQGTTLCTSYYVFILWFLYCGSVVCILNILILKLKLRIYIIIKYQFKIREKNIWNQSYKHILNKVKVLESQTPLDFYTKNVCDASVWCVGEMTEMYILWWSDSILCVCVYFSIRNVCAIIPYVLILPIYDCCALWENLNQPFMKRAHLHVSDAVVIRAVSTSL